MDWESGMLLPHTALGMAVRGDAGGTKDILDRAFLTATLLCQSEGRSVRERLKNHMISS